MRTTVNVSGIKGAAFLSVVVTALAGCSSSGQIRDVEIYHQRLSAEDVAYFDGLRKKSEKERLTNGAGGDSLCAAKLPRVVVLEEKELDAPFICEYSKSMSAEYDVEGEFVGYVYRESFDTGLLLLPLGCLSDISSVYAFRPDGSPRYCHSVSRAVLGIFSKETYDEPGSEDDYVHASFAGGLVGFERRADNLSLLILNAPLF